MEEEEPKYNVLYKQEMYLSNQDGKVYAFIDEETRHDFIILRIDSHEELKDLFIILARFVGDYEIRVDTCQPLNLSIPSFQVSNCQSVKFQPTTCLHFKNV